MSAREEVFEFDTSDSDPSQVLYASLPEMAQEVKNALTRRKMAEERLGTSDVMYVRHIGYVATTEIFGEPPEQLSLDT